MLLILLGTYFSSSENTFQFINFASSMFIIKGKTNEAPKSIFESNFKNHFWWSLWADHGEKLFIMVL